MKILDFYFKRGHILHNEYKKLIKSGMSPEEAKSHLYAFCEEKTAYLYAVNVFKLPESNVFLYDKSKYNNYLDWVNEITEENNDMKFDHIIQNPPYNGNLHLDFLEKGLNLLTENGRMIIIEPAGWLISFTEKNKKNRYNTIKNLIENHVESIVIETLNGQFGIEHDSPLSITTIDMSQTFNRIKFTCMGVTKYVKSIYDCNLIGEYDLVWGILNKVRNYEHKLKEHITKCPINDENVFYTKIANTGRCGCKSGARFHLDSYYYGNIFKYYYFNGMDDRDGITNTFPKKRDSGNKITDVNVDFCIFGTKTELENWQHFIYKTDLSLFVNLVRSVNQANNSKEFLPWLVDKQYTDEEINKLFGFTDEEIKLINRTIEKYKRNSPWFKRYMCGPGSIDSDPKKEEEIINKFMKELDEKYA